MQQKYDTLNVELPNVSKKKILSGMSECSHIKTTAKNEYIYELALYLYDLEGWSGLFFQLKSPNFSLWFSESSAAPPPPRQFYSPITEIQNATLRSTRLLPTVAKDQGKLPWICTFACYWLPGRASF